MARHCTVCHHAKRTEIEKALIRNESLQNIANAFGISDAAAWRHKTNHLAKTLLKSRKAKEAAQAVEIAAAAEAREGIESERSRDVMKEFGRCFDRANLLFEACDRWLRDPANPDQYDINPRAEDVYVTMIRPGQNGDPPVRQKKRLSVVLREIDGTNGFEVRAVETKYADPRKLVLSSIGELRELTRLQLQIFESWSQMGEFQREVLEGIGEASPEIREKIVRRLHERRGMYPVVEV
jgi:hypothetical protein